MNDAFQRDLDKCAANHQPLTPLSLLDRAAQVFPDREAVIHGDMRFTWAQFAARSRRLASALAAAGVGRGDVVSALLLNTPPMLEAHFGVPMLGAVLNAINTRLDPAGVAFILDHAETRVLLVDAELAGLANEALALARVRPRVIVWRDPMAPAEAEGEDYEAFLAAGDPDFAAPGPQDEWDAISLNYTSGTTGDPKGVVYHHRGAMLLATGNVLHAGMRDRPVYLWTLPMFHCNGWCFPWSIAAKAGTHVCLRQVRAGAIYDAIARHGVTHMCGAPIVMSTLLNADESEKRPLPHPVEFWTAAAPPPEAVLAAMAAAGFRVTHVYGLTEVYGPAVINEWKPEWDALPPAEQARLKARQGVRYAALEALEVLDPETMKPVPADGQTMGEVCFRGNVVMKGYFKNPEATAKAFRGGWFWSGDLAVRHPDGYIQLKDRSKDIIISGGENISSIEVEEALYRHPAVAFCAVVAKPDEKWGETPCAFVELREGAQTDEAELIAHCRAHLAHFKAPRKVVFGPLPKTSTGKIQKFELRARAREL
ncbi:acyl-CoA synthetase [Oceanicella actignis]|uniref:3-methylmercaptopropionyl-CoA ligase n=1 Tax=Oceanicella actignis TaxID=1189325 RepID=A0A1M7TFD2_9RHOB|nr:acyl-CoA synthetase [Oceanicella actignis]SET61233.1 fatty-acyl-CoA synthase [Oceanicella actignis]SHN69407.1 fatty-acyl-CoA synthase [Oceanicella actignis]